MKPPCHFNCFYAGSCQSKAVCREGAHHLREGKCLPADGRRDASQVLAQAKQSAASPNKVRKKVKRRIRTACIQAVSELVAQQQLLSSSQERKYPLFFSCFCFDLPASAFYQLRLAFRMSKTGSKQGAQAEGLFRVRISFRINTRVCIVPDEPQLSSSGSSGLVMLSLESFDLDRPMMTRCKKQSAQRM